MLHLVAFSSDIVEDSYTEGEGDSTGCGYGREAIGRDFAAMEDLVAYLAGHYGLPGSMTDYELESESRSLYTSKMVADHSNAQNGGWFEPTAAEIAAWKTGALKLYTEQFRIEFRVCT